MSEATYWDMFTISCERGDCDGRCYPLTPEDDPDHNRVQCHVCDRVYEIRLEVREDE